MLICASGLQYSCADSEFESNPIFQIFDLKPLWIRDQHAGPSPEYGCPKTAFKRDPDTDIRNFSQYFDESDSWKKLHIAQSFI